MITLEQTLKGRIAEAITALNLVAPEINLEHPDELSHGDYATNVALSLSKKAKIAPRELAEKIVALLAKEPIEYVAKIEVAGPGFVNFFLEDTFFVQEVGRAAHEDRYGKGHVLAGKKIMVEYTDPNPFKEFHIGHLMSNAIGESLARLIEFQNGTVVRANWQGDVGLHVAKALWGALHAEQGDTKTSQFWGKVYALGSEQYEADEVAKKEINELNKKIFERTDEKINVLYDVGRKTSLDHFENIYKVLGTKFDYYFFEGIEGREGPKIVEENLGTVFEKSDGAIVFKGEKYGLHTRVFINSQGLPTYEAKELGLNKAKFEKEPKLDKSIIITANEQSGYFEVVLKVLSLVLPYIGERTHHLAHGMLRFASGKMSSRKGNIITGESLIEDVKELVFEKIKDREFPETEKEHIAEVVAVGAIKYSILRQAVGGDIIFDLEKSISFEGDSGPYLQYGYTRASSVLEKAEKNHKEAPLPNGWQTTTLEKILVRFPEIATRAYSESAPHHLVTYLTGLVAAFNGFYAKEKIIGSEDPNSPHKILVTRAFANVMKQGLWLLGIEAPRAM